MTVTFPIIAPLDGEVLDPQWCSDITDAVNSHEDAVDELGQLTSSQSAYSFTGSSAIGTTITAVLTIASCVFRAGRAYSVENVGGVFADTTGRYADFALFKTSTAGTQLAAFYRTPAVGANGTQTNCYGKVYLRRTAATDLTITLVLTMVANAGTVVHDAAATRPRSLVVTDIGPAANWPMGFDVT